jgi:hypothetical protein
MSKFDFVHRVMIRKRKLALCAMLLVGLSASDGYCNAGIPAPLMIAASQLSTNPLQWIAVNMVMCITIEGAIYHYLQILHRPFVGSLVANVISLVAGVPLGIVGIIDPTWVILPTIVSIWVELVVLKRFRRKGYPLEAAEISNKNITMPVIGANILTNGLMILYGIINTV